jgi:pyruvate,orthophosphate dikinase
MTKWVYSFGADGAEGRGDMRELLGGKGANLHEMAALGLPVPPGFTITTEACAYFYAHGKTYPDELERQVDAAVAGIGWRTGRAFGDPANPLLVSVRSGARASMPGMMDTVLNLGLNDASVSALAKASGDERFSYDSYRRFIQMYSNVVLDVDAHEFEDLLERYKDVHGYTLDTDLTAADWRSLIVDYKAKVVEATDAPFPEETRDQLWGAIHAVLSSWMNQRAITYRRLNSIPGDWGTAVNVQAMVFGRARPPTPTGRPSRL